MLALECLHSHGSIYLTELLSLGLFLIAPLPRLGLHMRKLEPSPSAFSPLVLSLILQKARPGFLQAWWSQASKRMGEEVQVFKGLDYRIYISLLPHLLTKESHIQSVLKGWRNRLYLSMELQEFMVLFLYTTIDISFILEIGSLHRNPYVCI